MKFVTMMMVGLVLVLAACGVSAEADDPPKSMEQVRAELCHKIHINLSSGVAGSTSRWLSDDAYLWAWQSENC